MPTRATNASLRMRAALVVVAMLGVICLLAGCAKDDAKSCLGEYLDSLTSVSIEAVPDQQALASAQTLLKSAGLDCQSYGVSDSDFVQCYFDGFSYQVTGASKVKGNDDAMTAEVTMSVCDANQVMDSLEKASQGTNLLDAYQADPWQRQDVSVQVALVKDADSGNWKPADFNGFAATVLGGIYPAQELS